MTQLKTKIRQKPEVPLIYGKMAPQAPDLESAVLGALMLDIRSIELVLPILKMDDFYTDANQLVYNAIVILFTEGKPIDFMTVGQQLRKSSELEMVGGTYYVTNLTRDVVSSAHIEEHARIIKQKSLSRSLIRMAGELINDAYSDQEDVFELISKTEMHLSEIQQGIQKQGVQHIGQVAIETIDDMYKQSKVDNEMLGLKTGLKKYDQLTLGLTAPDLIIVAGGPGEGKSTLALQMAKNIAEEEPVAFFSLEMKTKQLMWKMFSADISVDVKTIRRGKLQDDQWTVLSKKVEEYQNSKMLLYDIGGLSIWDLRNLCRSLKAKYGIKAVFIDYLQLISTDGGPKNFGLREQEVNFISKQLKQMAMELDLPVVALSQLNRIEKGSKRMYRLSDLRESGAIEQDADGVVFVWRPSYHAVGNYKLDGHIDVNFEEDDVVIQLPKWRLGDTGYLRMKFNGKHSRFEEYNEFGTYIPLEVANARFETKFDNTISIDDDVDSDTPF